MLTDKEKIDLLKRLIETRQTAVTQRGNDELVSNAQQWLAELESGSDGWIRVEDTLPENGAYVLIYRSSRMVYIANYEDECFRTEHDNVYTDITHWQPITPPKK